MSPADPPARLEPTPIDDVRTDLASSSPRAIERRDRSGAPRSLAPVAAPIDFSDHESFHATVGRAVAGGGLFALVAELAANLAGIDHQPSLFTVAVTTGALAMIAARGKKLWKTLLGAALGLAGSVACVLSGRYPLLGAILLGAAAAPVLASGESTKRMAVTGAVAGAFGLAGLYVGHWMENIGLLAGLLPGVLATGVAGSAAGLFYGLAAVPKHIARPTDPVEGAYLQALEIKDGELHEMLARELSIHLSVRADLAQRGDDKTLGELGTRVGELAMRILHIAGQCRQIERDLTTAPAYELDERIRQLREKAESATDGAARQTYLSAAESLDGQRRQFDAIHRGRERVVARLHAHLALLEKVRFSLLHLRSANAERIGGETSPILDAIDELAREIDVTSSAVGEVFGRPQALPGQPPIAELPARTEATTPSTGVADHRS